MFSQYVQNDNDKDFKIPGCNSAMVTSNNCNILFAYLLLSVVLSVLIDLNQYV